MKATLLFGSAVAVLAFLPEELLMGLSYQRQDLLNGEWWRLWSGHFVHYSPQHALQDIMALLRKR
ncbi:hypothetical protein [Candidatus Magnetaquicoccus inordinatus]|uniref:hypothetical protein n=1 Tax=Candidatus Magnetaquicoccus inordinatus TaxID=2496818 RepID=UPI00102B91CF|nr:hypothetical protein [Candidatus Magnetaquicoccus inordinatus]